MNGSPARPALLTDEQGFAAQLNYRGRPVLLTDEPAQMGIKFPPPNPTDRGSATGGGLEAIELEYRTVA